MSWPALSLDLVSYIAESFARSLLSTVTSTYVLAVLICVVTRILCSCIYNTLWHPLAKYPGPRVAGVTDLYAAWHGLIGDIHLDIRQCHKKYGKFVRYGPNRLLVNTTEGFHDIYGHRKNFQKSKAYLPMVPDKDSWCTLTSIDKNIHRYKRRLITQGLSEDSLRAFEPKLLAHLDTYCSKLGESKSRHNCTWTEPRNMSDYNKWLTLDLMGDFGFGRSLGLLDCSKNRFIIDVMHLYSWVMGFYEQYPEIASLRLERLVLFARGILRLNTATQDQWETWKETFGASVLQKGHLQQNSLFGGFLNSRKSFSLSELWAEGSFLMLAGSDTSATTLSGLFFYLAHCPQAHEKLEKEIRTTFAHSSDIVSGPQLFSCAYLHACISETLRLSPPTPGAPWREVQVGGAVVDGDYIAEGYDVGTCIYAIHHDDNYFPQPYTFMPERWIPGGFGSSQQLATALNAFNPFLLGPRGCPGRSLALLQISLTLARVIFDLNFHLADTELSQVGSGDSGVTDGQERVTEFRLQAHVTASCNGPQLQFCARSCKSCALEGALTRA